MPIASLSFALAKDQAQTCYNRQDQRDIFEELLVDAHQHPTADQCAHHRTADQRQ